MPPDAETVRCGFCGYWPEEHGDSDHGPMSVCPTQRECFDYWRAHHDGDEAS